MPHSRRSLALTDQYRTRLRHSRQRIDAFTERSWRALMPADLDGQVWVKSMTAALTQVQIEVVRASSGYLSAFATVESGRRQTVILDSRRYAGKSRDGRPLKEALQSPLIGTKAALKEGRDLPEALSAGLTRALRGVGLDTDQIARQSVLDAVAEDERFTGWTRAVSGTCGACLAASPNDEDFEYHPNCQCVPEPRVRGVRDAVPRLVGLALFESMSTQHQDEALGEETAALVRSGEVPLHELVKRSPLHNEQDFITQAPVKALT